MERLGARPVHVEVLERDERCAARSRRGEDGVLERRELLGPALVVRRVEAEVARVGTGGDRPGEPDVGGVAPDGLDARHRRGAAAVDHANPATLLEERCGDSATGGPGAEDDVQAGGHDRAALAGMNVPMIMLWRNATVIAP
jgi:hypothetical protein